MTATGHALIGTTIAAAISNPLIGLPLAFLSHIAADAFPHWDAGTNEKTKGRDRVMYEAAVDVLLGFCLSYLLIAFVFPQTNLVYVFFMIISAQALDWLTAPYYFFHMQAFKWAYNIQKRFDHRQQAPWGVINQVGIIVILIVIVKLIQR